MRTDARVSHPGQGNSPQTDRIDLRRLVPLPIAMLAIRRRTIDCSCCCSPLRTPTAGCPSIRRKACVKQNFSWRCGSTAELVREVEDQSSEQFTLHHPSRGSRPHQPSMRPSITGHDASMRTPLLVRGARALIQCLGLVGPCQGHPRAALDAGDLRIGHVLAKHPVESHG